METKYGAEQGHYREMDTLTTLAFFYPTKAAFFQKELGNYIVLSQRQHFDPFSVQGSYAGALGIPQFMPTSYLYYGVTYSQDKKKADLFENQDDAIMSVANFLMQNGWERDIPVAVEAKVIGNQYKSIIKTDSRKPLNPKLNLEELANYKVYSDDPNDSRMNGYWKANLMLFKGDKPEYWLGFVNFYVLTQYNNSDQYAMTAYFLGKELQRSYREYLDIKAKSVKNNTSKGQPGG